MRHTTLIICLLLATAINAPADGGRCEILLNDGWTVKPISNPDRNAETVAVTLPHTWNATYTIGERGYNRETMVYQRKLEVTTEMEGKRLFLHFEGVNSVADVFVNRRSVGNHKGGYTAFCLEITDFVRQGDNDLEVWVGNSYRSDVLPISGDFNVYGGIHRPVHLLVTEQDCISPLFYASPGVFVRQNMISAEQADITVETLLSLNGGDKPLKLRVTVTDADGDVVKVQECEAAGEDVNTRLIIPNPHLWDGRDEPYLYNVKVELIDTADKIADVVEQKTGFRFFHVDPDKGFFLNGRPYDLHGFNRHEDFKGVGSALTENEYRRDIDLIDEMGATVLRLAHYPHGEPIYSLCDENGIVVWSEIPLVGPGGYLYTGYVRNVEENARQTARELVFQKFNHPSVCFWGIFNELLLDDGGMFEEYDNPIAFVKELNGIFHEADPTRLTTFATCVDQTDFLGCTDLVAWNKYFDWKDSEEAAASFFDEARRISGGQPVGVSEYGRGGSPRQHADPLHFSTDSIPSTVHPEEYQAVCHEGYWAAFRTRPYLWLKAIWQFAEFQSSIRDEGDTPGLNDKGMVTYDRETRKDVFYFYKANWNPEPMLHLCSKRFTEREYAETSVKVYTNLSSAVLYVNGEKIGKGETDELHRIIWDDITLRSGENTIFVEGYDKGGKFTDSCTWVLK